MYGIIGKIRKYKFYVALNVSGVFEGMELHNTVLDKYSLYYPQYNILISMFVYT